MGKYFKDTSNLISFTLAVIFSVLLYVFKPTDAVPYIIFFIILLLLIISIWLNIKMYLDNKDKDFSPVITLIECIQGRCICKSNDFLTYNSVVTFYERQGNYEKVIGYGYVETVTGGKAVQIIPKSEENQSAVFIDYINNNKTNIIIRPTITIDILEKIKFILER